MQRDGPKCYMFKIKKRIWSKLISISLAKKNIRNDDVVLVMLMKIRK